MESIKNKLEEARRLIRNSEDDLRELCKYGKIEYTDPSFNELTTIKNKLKILLNNLN